MKARLLSLVMIVAGISVLCYGIMSGQGGISFILFIPVLHASGPVAAVGGLLLMLGFFMLFTTGFVLRPTTQTAPLHSELGYKSVEAKSSGILLIGPIPIIFGNDKRMVLVLSIIAVILMALALLFLY